MLREIVKRWANHKVMVRWLSRSLPPLNEVGLTKLNDEVRDVVISLIDQERKGEQIDRALLKMFWTILFKLEWGKWTTMRMILKLPCLQYCCVLFEKGYKLDPRRFLNCLLIQELCLNKSRSLILCFCCFKISEKLCNALSVKENWILPDILSLYHSMLLLNVRPWFNKLKMQQVFVRKVIELHDKCMAYVNDCFMNHTLFYKALKEAFEVFCNKGVAGSSSAELLATFCDNILKKGGSEKLSDEAIEETFEKKLACHLLFDKSANDDHERSLQKIGGNGGAHASLLCIARSSCFLVIGHASLEQQMDLTFA
ncbi:LOW QUALITY PROTEIN: hypothetical protein V2J09_011249 [Rumex salicifolius]